ncbi:MAG: peptidylprolyl isomerase [Pirellulales bacterium]|nr:peptidylprolyl isomerase [Pirellulales bacterium]
MGQFYLIGDPNTGDGGDQYEKALPLAKSLIDAGAGQTWPQLYLWGAVAAYSVNDFPLAKEYFAKADETRAANVSGTSPRLLDLLEQARRNLPQLERNWTKEQEIRAAEEKADDLPRVKLATTRGDVVIELFENEAPEAVASFLSLVKQGFYDNVVFHRVLPGFMAQGGDPTGTGTGGPGYCIKCECYTPNYRRHFRGSLSMAHAGRDTGGSQFFLTFVPTSFLDGKHTVFGRVIEGMDVAASLRRRDPDDPSTTPDMIVKAEIVRDRGHAYKFTKLPGR